MQIHINHRPHTDASADELARARHLLTEQLHHQARRELAGALSRLAAAHHLASVSVTYQLVAHTPATPAPPETEQHIAVPHVTTTPPVDDDHPVVTEAVRVAAASPLCNLIRPHDGPHSVDGVAAVPHAA